MADIEPADIQVMEPEASDVPAVEEEVEDPEAVNLDELQFLPPIEEAVDEEEEPAQPATPAERKRLTDLIAEDPEYAREAAAYSQEREARAAQAAQAFARQQLEAEQKQAVRASYMQARQEELAYRNTFDAWADNYGATVDAIDAQEKRNTERVRRAERDQEWRLWQATDAVEQRQSQIVTEAEKNARTATAAAIANVFQTKLPAPLRDKLHLKNYPGSWGEGVQAHLADWVDGLIEHGRELERAEAGKASATTQRQVRAQAGLAAPAPDMGAPARSRSILPTEAQLDAMSYETKQEMLAKDPQLYEKVYAAARRRA